MGGHSHWSQVKRQKGAWSHASTVHKSTPKPTSVQTTRSNSRFW